MFRLRTAKSARKRSPLKRSSRLSAREEIAAPRLCPQAMPIY
jgi:hypothetical protein